MGEGEVEDGWGIVAIFRDVCRVTRLRLCTPIHFVYLPVASTADTSWMCQPSHLLSTSYLLAFNHIFRGTCNGPNRPSTLST